MTPGAVKNSKLSQPPAKAVLWRLVSYKKYLNPMVWTSHLPAEPTFVRARLWFEARDIARVRFQAEDAELVPATDGEVAALAKRGRRAWILEPEA